MTQRTSAELGGLSRLNPRDGARSEKYTESGLEHELKVLPCIESHAKKKQKEKGKEICTQIFPATKFNHQI